MWEFDNPVKEGEGGSGSEDLEELVAISEEVAFSVIVKHSSQGNVLCSQNVWSTYRGVMTKRIEYKKTIFLSLFLMKNALITHAVTLDLLIFFTIQFKECLFGGRGRICWVYIKEPKSIGKKYNNYQL